MALQKNQILSLESDKNKKKLEQDKSKGLRRIINQLAKKIGFDKLDCINKLRRFNKEQNDRENAAKNGV